MINLPFDLFPVGGMDVDTRGVEKTMWAVNKLLGEKDYETLDELQCFMDTLIGGLPKYTPKNDVEKAQSVVYDAYQTS